MSKIDDEHIPKVRSALNDWLEDRRLSAEEHYNQNIEIMERLTESPIEALLGAYLLLQVDGYNPLEFRETFAGDRWPVFGTVFCCQCPIGEYRTDFAFRCCDRGLWRLLVVECDGHDFHEKTKEQARRDRRRDRWFSMSGVHVFRFTGSEIWRDPATCAEQVSSKLSGLMDEMLAEHGISGWRRDPLK